MSNSTYPALAKTFGAKLSPVRTVRVLRVTRSEIQRLTGAPALVEVVDPRKNPVLQLERLVETPAPQRKFARRRA
jgi:hypothetical protein